MNGASPVEQFAPAVPRRANRSVKYYIGLCFIFFALTPWAHWGTNSLDSQPWTFVFGTIYIFSSAKLRSNINILLICLSVVLGILFGMWFGGAVNAFLVLRGVLSYLTFAVALIAAYDFLKSFGFPVRLFLGVNALWIAFALIERVSPSIVAMVSALRTTESRGVTSLASEPSFFAIYLFFSAWIYLAVSNFRFGRSQLILVGVNVFAIVFLAKSALGILLLGLSGAFLTAYLISTLRVKFLILFSVLAMLGFIVIATNIDVLAESRVGSLVQKVSELGPLELLLLDASTNARVESFVIPVIAAIEMDFVPMGFERFGEIGTGFSNEYQQWFWYKQTGNIISSWVGAFIFELGFFGLFVIGFIFAFLARGGVKNVIQGTFLMIVLLNAIPVAFPMVSMVIVAIRLRDRALLT